MARELAPRAPPDPALERNIVVQITRRRPASAAARGRAAAVTALVAALGHRAFARPAAAAVEHDQFTAEALEHHLRGVLFRARLVGPFARLQGAFQIHLGPLVQILLHHIYKALIED